MGWLRRLNSLLRVKHFDKCWAHSKHHGNVVATTIIVNIKSWITQAGNRCRLFGLLHVGRMWEQCKGSIQPPTSFDSTFGRLLSFLTAAALIQVSLPFDLLHYSSSPLILLSYNLCCMPADLSLQTWVCGIILLLNNFQCLMLLHIVQTCHSGTENSFSPAPAYFASLFFLACRGCSRQSSALTAMCAFLGPGIVIFSHYSNPTCLSWASSNFVSSKN